MWQNVRLRPGAVDMGRINEQKMATLLAIRLSLDNSVADFWMLTNIDGVGDFDDLVACVEKEDGRRLLYFMQLKHRENKSIQLSSFECETSDFSLRKYQESYNIIKSKIGKEEMFKNITIDNVTLIFHTNARLSGKGKFICCKEIDHSFPMNTSKDTNAILQIKNMEGVHSDLDSEFLSKFILFTQQANAPNIDELIRLELGSHFFDIHNTSIFTLTHFFAVWSLGRKKEISSLQKKDIQGKLLEVILEPYIIDPCKVQIIKPEILNIVRQTFLGFNVTSISQDNSVKYISSMIIAIMENICGFVFDIPNSWNDRISHIQLDIIFSKTRDSSRNSFLSELKNRSRYQPHITFRDLYILAWQCKLVPLILNCVPSQGTVQNCLIKFQKIVTQMNFVLIQPNFEINHLEMFENVFHIKDSFVQNEALIHMNISLNGKVKFNLLHLQNHHEVIKKITPDIFLLLLNETIILGRESHIEEYYIDRCIRLPKIKSEVLDLCMEPYTSHGRPDIFIILTDSNNEFISRYEKYVMRIDQYTAIPDYVENKKYILLVDMNDMDKLFETTAHLKDCSNEIVHIMRFLNEEMLEHVYSSGSIENLSKYRFECSEGTSENNLSYTLDANVNILINGSGMGKTSFLKSTARKYKPMEWISYLDLNDHIYAITTMEKIEPLIDYLLNFELENCEEHLREFCAEVFFSCLHNKRLVCLIDHYDEIESEEVLNLLKNLASSSMARLWISSTSRSRSKFEEKFVTLALELSNMSDLDYRTLAHKYLKYNQNYSHLTIEQVEKILDAIDMHTGHMDEMFFKTPLYVKMAAEVFAEDYDRIDERIDMSMVDLYNAFIDMHSMEYKPYEVNSFRRVVSKFALKLLYYPEQLKGIIEFDDLSEYIPLLQQNHHRKTLLKDIKENGDAVFGHRSYAEFLVAQWISDEIECDKPSEKTKWLKLMDRLSNSDTQAVNILIKRIKHSVKRKDVEIIGKIVETSVKSLFVSDDMKKAEHIVKDARDDIKEAAKKVEIAAKPFLKNVRRFKL